MGKCESRVVCGTCELRGKVCFVTFPRNVFSTALICFLGQRRQELSFRAVLSDAISCDHQGQCLVQVLVDDRLVSSQGGSPLGTLDLHDQIVKAFGVVPVNGALVSLREDQINAPVPAGYKWRASLYDPRTTGPTFCVTIASNLSR